MGFGPPFVDAIEGGEATFADFQGGPLVVDFWASWCPACVAELPEFQSVHEDRGTQGCVMIEAPIGLAFAAGLVATLNPCGFAMLPADLSYFMGMDADLDEPTAGAGEALNRTRH